ncbi:MAG: hypothetical protein QGI60_01210 [archaeon]|nr:hypothetical protein [archaeon]
MSHGKRLNYAKNCYKINQPKKGRKGQREELKIRKALKENMVVITDPYIILAVNIVGGLAIIFFVPWAIKYALNFNVGLAKVGVVKRYWDFILSKKILQIIGVLWIIAAVVIFFTY